MRRPDAEYVASLGAGSTVLVRSYGGAEVGPGRVVHITLYGSVRALMGSGEYATFNPTGYKRGGSSWLDRPAPKETP